MLNNSKVILNRRKTNKYFIVKQLPRYIYKIYTNHL